MNLTALSIGPGNRRQICSVSTIYIDSDKPTIPITQTDGGEPLELDVLTSVPDES